jgi:L-amino acid N-acyltransferase YncA
MQLQFQQATIDELPAILSFLKEAALWLQEKKINQWAYWLQPPADKLLWISEGINNGEFYFVTNAQHERIAIFRLMNKDELYWGKRNDNAIYVHSLVVSRNVLGNNIGKTILETIANDAIKKGVHLFRLDCNAANKNLCNYYESLGFVKVAEKQMPYSLNNLYEKAI